MKTKVKTNRFQFHSNSLLVALLLCHCSKLYNNNYKSNSLSDATQPQLFRFEHGTYFDSMLSQTLLLPLSALFSPFIVQHTVEKFSTLVLFSVVFQFQRFWYFFIGTYFISFTPRTFVRNLLQMPIKYFLASRFFFFFFGDV